jgi:hypothetical protein
VIEPAPGEAEDLGAWVAPRREPLLADLRRHGALLLRGFAGTGLEPLRRVALVLGGELMEYTYRAAHRRHLAGRVYTSADYPPSHEIFLHNESAYAARWPEALPPLPPARAGRRLHADRRRAAGARTAPALDAARVRREGVLVRNFGTGLFGPSWRDAFQTGERAEVDAYCRANSLEAEWLGPGRLRTRQRRPALIRHR